MAIEAHISPTVMEMKLFIFTRTHFFESGGQNMRVGSMYE